MEVKEFSLYSHLFLTLGLNLRFSYNDYLIPGVYNIYSLSFFWLLLSFFFFLGFFFLSLKMGKFKNTLKHNGLHFTYLQTEALIPKCPYTTCILITN